VSQATQGGSESLYPEYRDRIQQWMTEDAAKKEAAVKKPAKK